MRKPKLIIAFIVLVFSFQTIYSQACGVYRINYVGTIESESFQIKKIKLPSTQFLHGLEDWDYFYEIDFKNELNIKIASHLTSHLYDNEEYLINFYKEKRSAFSIIFVIIKGNKETEIIKHLNWEDIQVRIIDDGKLGALFEFDFGKIRLK